MGGMGPIQECRGLLLSSHSGRSSQCLLMRASVRQEIVANSPVRAGSGGSGSGRRRKPQRSPLEAHRLSLSPSPSDAAGNQIPR
jgi:hypothetical protein